MSPPRRELLPPPLPHLPDASVYFQGAAGPTQVTLDPSCSVSADRPPDSVCPVPWWQCPGRGLHARGGGRQARGLFGASFTARPVSVESRDTSPLRVAFLPG